MRLHELVKGLAYLPERTAGFGDHLNSDERPNVGHSACSGKADVDRRRVIMGRVRERQLLSKIAVREPDRNDSFVPQSAIPLQYGPLE